jgi:hypothetical protein
MPKLSDLELKKGMIAVDRAKYPLDMQISEAEFEKVSRNMAEFQGVDHAKRKEFLKANGYKLTHENMIDSSLPTKTGQK